MPSTITEQQADKIILSLENLTRGLARGFVGQGNIVSKQQFQSEVEHKEKREVSKEAYDKYFADYTEAYEKHLKRIHAFEEELEVSKKKGNERNIHEKQKQLENESKVLASVIQSWTTFENTLVVIDEEEQKRLRLLKDSNKEYENQVKLIEENNKLTKAQKEYQKKQLEKQRNEDNKKIKDKLADRLSSNDSTKKQLSDSLTSSLESLTEPNSGLGKIITSAAVDAFGPVGALVGGAIKILEGISSAISKGFDEALNLQGQYLAGINTRLNGLTEQASTYNQIMENMQVFAGNQYISQRKLTENIAKLTDNGIAYNLEERALLETIKDRMVTTFGVVEGQLDRLVRAQQYDITKAQMGSEIELNKMFNALFQDTSYLSDMYDSVSSALIDVTASRGYDEAVQINFATQKWLGSLYSLGMSQNAITSIAQGLSALATGNIDQLNGTPIGNLFALSSRNAGISYTDMLSNGINASEVNDLMQSMVLYLAQIASQTSGSNVARTAMLNQIGGNFTYSDIRAITNLASQSNIMNSIYGNTQNYDTSMTSWATEIQKVEGRTPLQYRVETLMDNMLLAVGNSILGNSGIGNYVAYKLSDMLPGVVGTFAKAAWGLSNAGSIWDAIKDITGTVGLGVNGSVLQYREATGSINNVRGSIYGYNPSTVGALSASTGISYSSAISNAASASEAQAYNLYQKANATTLSASNTTGTAGVLRDVGDIFAELFEQQNHPIRVAIAKVEEGAKADLGIGFNGMLVDVQNEDINTIISQVYTIRGAY